PEESLAVETLKEGKGTAARKGDLVVADYVGYRWSGSERKLLASSYAQGSPGAFPTGQVVPGLAKALVGARPGSRVVARIPPEEGFGEKGDPKHRVDGDDTLVYVLDVRAVYGRSAGPRGARQAPLDDRALPRVAGAGAGQGPAGGGRGGGAGAARGGAAGGGAEGSAGADAGAGRRSAGEEGAAGGVAVRGVLLA